MTINCPQCETEISSEDFNVSKDVAYCQRCEETFEFSSLVDDSKFDDVDLGNPPKYITWFSEGSGATLIYKKRPAIVWFLIPFMCVWSGFSMFMMFNSFVKNGLAVETLFFLPFLFGTIIMMMVILLLLFGHSKITSDGDSIKVLTGIGNIGLTKQFQIVDVKQISLSHGNVTVNNRQVEDILVEFKSEKKEVRFGAMFEDKSKEYIAAYVNAICKNKGKS